MPPADSPYGPDIDAEHAGWTELQRLVRRLTVTERLVPGYYGDQAWTVKDLVAHVGTWLAEAEIQLERLAVGTYDGRPTDIDALNASFLVAMRDQPWTVVSTQAHAARTQMLHDWFDLRVATAEASWWIRKSGGDHYGEHLERLREWVDELIERRSSEVA